MLEMLELLGQFGKPPYLLLEREYRLLQGLLQPVIFETFLNSSRRQFQTKCASCQRQIQPTDWVRRARSFVYHLACFSCDHCKRQLSTGEQFSLQDNRLLCKQHYLELVQGEESEGSSTFFNLFSRLTKAEDQACPNHICR